MQFRIKGILQLSKALAKIAELADTGKPFIVIVRGDEKRTDAMNRTVHKWFDEVAKQKTEMFAEVKAEFNLMYGVPIKRRDNPEWGSAYGYLFDSLSHAAKLKAIRMLDIPITRDMNIKQLTEYMDQMQKDCHEQGYHLTIPEER